MLKMRRFLTQGTLAIALIFGFVSTASAGKALELIKDIEVHGFASSSYSHNFANPLGTRQNNLRVYDFDANTFKFDIAELVLKRDAVNVGEAGFRVDMTSGFSGPQGNKVGGPNVAGADVSDDDFDLQIGYVQYNAPIGNGLLIDIGKFGTNIGSEVMDGYDGFNYTFSRSFLFFLGPFTHNGIRVQYQLSDTVGLLGILSNGHDTTTDTNDAKGIGGQISWAATDNAVIYLNYFGTAEPQTGVPNNGDNFRNYFDTVVEVSLSKNLLVNLNAVYGTEADATGLNTGDHSWWGFSGIVRYDVNNWFSLNYRGQTFHDEDGGRSGTGVRRRLWAMSITPEIRVTDNMVVRAEYRHDESDIPAFDSRNGNSISYTQDTLAFNALFYF